MIQKPIQKMVQKVLQKWMVKQAGVLLLFLMMLFAVPCVSSAAQVKPETGQNGQVDKLAFTRSAKKLTAGKTYQFKTNASGTVTWSAGNKKIASVNKNGLVRAKRYGKTRIYASVGDKKISVDRKSVV